LYFLLFFFERSPFGSTRGQAPKNKKIAAGDKLPEILSHGYKNINSSPDRKALSGSSNNIFLLNAIAQNFLSAIYHRRVILNKLIEKIQMRDSFHLN